MESILARVMRKLIVLYHKQWMEYSKRPVANRHGVYCDCTLEIEVNHHSATGAFSFRSRNHNETLEANIYKEQEHSSKARVLVIYFAASLIQPLKIFSAELL